MDSGSASASELFARVVQLEKRGTVIGDRTEGAVMEARHFTFSQDKAFGQFLPYGAELTVADLKMTDGNSLEHHGVVPDEILLPSPEEWRWVPILNWRARCSWPAFQCHPAPPARCFPYAGGKAHSPKVISRIPAHGLAASGGIYRLMIPIFGCLPPTSRKRKGRAAKARRLSFIELAFRFPAPRRRPLTTPSR